jgi:hypothetical protein
LRLVRGDGFAGLPQPYEDISVEGVSGAKQGQSLRSVRLGRMAFESLSGWVPD